MQIPNEGELLASINEWVAVESKTDETEGVNRMMDLAESSCASIGMHVERIPGRHGFADCVLARPEGDSGEGDCILLLAHLDTVHPSGTLARNPIRTEGERAFGPGILDMKGGAYLAVAACGAVRADGGAHLPARLLFVSDEEVGSVVSRQHTERQAARAKHALVVEPGRTADTVVTGRKGTIRMILEAHGRPAHSGVRPQDGRSAIREIAHQILELESWSEPDRGITVTIGLVRGGSAPNVVPERCEAEIDVRVPTAAASAEMLRRLRSLKPRFPDIRLSIDGNEKRPPYEKNPQVAALFEFARAEAEALGMNLRDCATGGASDGNFTAAMGVPTLDGLGVEGGGAHTLEEHILIPSLVPRATLLARLCRNLR